MSNESSRKRRRNELSNITSNERHFRDVWGDDYDKSAEDRGLCKGLSVKLFVAMVNDTKEVGKATLSSAGSQAETVQRTLHLHPLPQTADQDLVVITAVSFKEELKNLTYPYTFRGGEGPPDKLKDIFRAGMYAWDSRLMKPLSNSSTTAGADGDGLRASPLLKRQKLDKRTRIKGNKEAHPLEQQVIDVIATSDEEGGITPSPADDIIEVVNDEHLAEVGKNVDIRSYPSTLYSKVVIRVLLSQLIKPDCTLRLVNDEHSIGLKGNFTKYGYDYDSGLMTVTVRRSENRELQGLNKDISLASLVEEKEEIDEDNEKVKFKHLKSSLLATTIDGLHRRQALITLLQEKGKQDKFKWLHEPLRMVLFQRRDGKDISNTELLHLGSQKNQVSSTVRPIETLEDYVFAIVSYLKSFAKERNLDVTDVRPSNLADQMRAVQLVPNMKQKTYHRYARICKIFALHPSAYEKFLSFSPERHPKIGAAHLDHGSYFGIDRQGILLFLDSVNSYVRNPTITGTFSAHAFYTYMKELYETCRHGRVTGRTEARIDTSTMRRSASTGRRRTNATRRHRATNFGQALNLEDKNTRRSGVGEIVQEEAHSLIKYRVENHAEYRRYEAHLEFRV